MIVPRRFLAVTYFAGLAVLALGAAPTVAHAQTDEERAGARAAADAGLQAYNAKNWAACADYFARAESLVDVPPHLLYIARCRVQLGQLVSGREAYMRIRRTVIAPDKPQSFRDAKASAETELAALEPRIPYLNVQVAGGTGKAVTVKMDGVDVPTALVGIPRPVDPGAHKVEAAADGMTAAAKSVTLQEGQHQDVKLELVAGASGASVAATGGPTTVPITAEASTPPPAVGTDLAQPPPSVEADKGSGGAPLRVIGLVTAGVGVAGLVVGGVFFAQASSDTSNADNKYNQFNCSKSCTPDQQQQVKDLDKQSTNNKIIAFVAGGAGIVALGVGLTLVFLPRKTSVTKQAITVTPEIGLGSLGLHGSF